VLDLLQRLRGLEASDLTHLRVEFVVRVSLPRTAHVERVVYERGYSPEHLQSVRKDHEHRLQRCGRDQLRRQRFTARHGKISIAFISSSQFLVWA
jgi:hypothetical protein